MHSIGRAWISSKLVLLVIIRGKIPSLFPHPSLSQKLEHPEMHCSLLQSLPRCWRTQQVRWLWIQVQTFPFRGNMWLNKLDMQREGLPPKLRCQQGAFLCIGQIHIEDIVHRLPSISHLLWRMQSFDPLQMPTRVFFLVINNYNIRNSSGGHANNRDN